MSHLSPTLSTLPPELKSLIARMARDQDELFRAPAYSLLSNTPAAEDEELRTELSQSKDGGGSLYGSSLPMLALVSRDWRDAASKYLNESITAWKLFLVQSHRDHPLAKRDEHASPAFERIKPRIRRLTFHQWPLEHGRSLFDMSLMVTAELPGICEVSLDAGRHRLEPSLDGEASDSDDDSEEDYPRTIAGAFLQGIVGYPVIGPAVAKKITSLTIAFDINQSGSTSQAVLARLIRSLPSLNHLRLIDPFELFHHSDAEDGLQAALDGAQHLTSLSIRLSPDYVFSNPEEELEEIYMVARWLSWKPQLKALDIVTSDLGNSLPAFIAGVAPTLERLSLSYKHVADVYLPSSKARKPFLDPTSFPLLSHVELTGNENDFILESILGSPISHLHLTSTSDTSCDLLTDPPTIDQYLPTLRHLRLDSEPFRPRTALADLRERCEDAGVVLHVGAPSASGHAIPPSKSKEVIQDASGETERLLERALEQARRNTAAGDEMRTAELTKALQGLRVLLKMQTE
ncbi:hypothetical protein RQP46_003693 [Phenoliferia psychrophenolica]